MAEEYYQQINMHVPPSEAKHLVTLGYFQNNLPSSFGGGVIECNELPTEGEAETLYFLTTDGTLHYYSNGSWQDFKEKDKPLAMNKFAFVYYTNVMGQTGYQDNMKKTLVAKTASQIDNPDTYPYLLTVQGNKYKCYPFNHSACMEADGYDPNNPGLITDGKMDYYIYMQKTDTDIWKIKCNYHKDNEKAPWGNSPSNSNDYFIIGIVNNNEYPVIPYSDLAFAHMFTANVQNPHQVEINDTVDFNGQNAIFLTNDGFAGGQFFYIAPAIMTDKGIIPLRLNSFMQNAPAILLEGGARIKGNMAQGTGGKIEWEADDGQIKNVKVIKNSTTGKYELQVEQ